MRSRTGQQQRGSPQTPAPVAGVLQRKCACGTHTGGGATCSACAEKERSLQRHAINDRDPTEVPPIVYQVLRSPGQPLDPETRAFFEPRFGHDFSDVRVHADGRAARSAQAVGALAYTVGSTIVFGDGRYDPKSRAGLRLLAHELAHVTQQQEGFTVREVIQRGNPDILVVDNGRDTLEEEADRAAGLVVQSEPRSHGESEPRLDVSLAGSDSSRPAGDGGIHHASVSRARGETASSHWPSRQLVRLSTVAARLQRQRFTDCTPARTGQPHLAQGDIDIMIDVARLGARVQVGNALNALTAVQAGTATLQQQAALQAHFGVLTPAQRTVVRTRLTNMHARLANLNLFICNSAGSFYCRPPRAWCAYTNCPTTADATHLCPPFFQSPVPCDEPDRQSLIVHEAARAAGACAPDVPPGAGYPGANPISNVFSYSGFARAVSAGPIAAPAIPPWDPGRPRFRSMIGEVLEVLEGRLRQRQQQEPELPEARK
jgi:hypothetical protein